MEYKSIGMMRLDWSGSRGDEVCNKFVKHCVEGRLAKEMGREDLFDCTQKMNLF